jgi:hypothetical protein
VGKHPKKKKENLRAARRTCRPKRMLPSNQSLLNLPFTLLAEVLTEWLELQSLLKLDNACCSAGSRKTYLELVGGSEFCLREVPAALVLSSEGMQWFIARYVKLKRVVIDGPAGIDLVLVTTFLDKCGRRVEKVRIVRYARAEISVRSAIIDQLSNTSRFIRVLTIEDCGLLPSESLGALLSACSQSLQRLELTRCSLVTVLPTGQLPDLRILHLSNCPLGLSNARRLIKASPSLRSFMFSDPKESAEHLLDTLAAHCPLLQVLSYEISLQDPSSLVQLLRACMNMEVVVFALHSVEAKPCVIEGHVAAVMNHCKRLKALSLRTVYTGSIMVLAEQAKMLRHISLFNARFESDPFVLALAENCSNLISLELSSVHNNISQTALVALFSRLSSVVELNLFDSCLSDDVLLAIAAHCPLLEVLHLSY